MSNNRWIAFALSIGLAVASALFGALRTVVTSYNEIKAVRRLLRAHGFRSPTQPVITREQASLFHELLARLNREQLALEALYREVTLPSGHVYVLLDH